MSKLTDRTTSSIFNPLPFFLIMGAAEQLQVFKFMQTTQRKWKSVVDFKHLSGRPALAPLVLKLALRFSTPPHRSFVVDRDRPCG